MLIVSISIQIVWQTLLKSSDGAQGFKWNIKLSFAPLDNVT